MCHLYACEADYVFVIKSLMYTIPYRVVVVSQISIILILGYAIRICESPLTRNDPLGNNFRIYANSFWNIIITMATVFFVF